MPIEFCTSLDLNLVYARWWGRVDTDTRQRNFEAYLNDIHYKAGRPELIDLSGVTGSDFDFERAQALIHQLRSKGPPQGAHTHRVLWAPEDVPYGCARIFQSVSEVSQIGHVEVFRNEQNALLALGLPQKTIASLLDASRFHAQREVSPPRLEAVGDKLYPRT